MSDAPTPTPASEPKAEPKPAAEKPRRRRGKWTRRLMKTVFGLVLAFIVVRIGIFFLLAFTLRKVAHFYDLDLTYGRQEITMLGGDAGLWDVKVSRTGEEKPFLVADYVHGNLSMLALLRTNIEIWRMEADGVSLDVTRAPDGKLPLLDLVMAQMNSTPVATKATVQSNQPIQLEAPFKIDALRLHRFRAKITDLAVTPTFQETVYADLRVSDLRNPEKPTSIEADVWSDSILSAMRFYGTGTASKQVVKFDANFRGSGLNLGPVAEYLVPLGLNPVASAIDWNGKVQFSTDAGPTPSAISAKLGLRDISARADTREVVYVNTVDLAAKSISSTGIALSSLKVDGVRVHADRATNGRLRFAGIELVSPAPSTQPTRKAVVPSTRPLALPASRPTTGPSGAPAFITLDELVMSNLKASFGDEALPKPSTIEFWIDEMKTSQIGTDDHGRSYLPIDGKLRAPGIASAISVAGRLHPFEPPFGANLTISAQGVQLDALRPYLQPLGITSTLSDAKLTAGVDASLEPLADGGAQAELRLKDVVLQDAQQRLKLPLVDLRHVSIRPAANRFDIAQVNVVGPELSLVRHADGSLETVGFQYTTPLPTSAATTTQPAAQPLAISLPAASSLPVVTLGKLDWHGVKVEVEDQATAQPSRFTIDDIGAELRNIVFNLGEDKAVTGDGTLRAWASIPGLLGRLDVDGQTKSAAGDFKFETKIDAKQISLQSLASYLQPLGIIPTLRDGQVLAGMRLGVARSEDNLRISVGGKLEFTEAGRSLASVSSFDLRGVTLGSAGIEVQEMDAQSTRLLLQRGADGSLEACGLKLSTKAPPATGAPIPAIRLLPIPQLPLPLAIQKGTVGDVHVTWLDHSFEPPIQADIGVAAQLGPIVIDQRPGAAQTKPAPFSADLTVNQTEKLKVDGSFSLLRDQVAATAEINGTGLDGSLLSGYLPAGVMPTLKEGTFAAKAQLALRDLDSGAQQVDLKLQDVSLKQGDTSLVKLDHFLVEAAQVDLPKNRIDIKAIEVGGASVMATVGADSSLYLPALRIDPSIEPPPSTKPAAPIEVTADGAQASAEEVAQRLAQARKPLPLLTVERVDVSLDRAGVTIESLGAGSTIALENLRLTNVGPIQIGGDKAAELPPVRMKVQTALMPLAKSISLDLEAAPFASEARFAGKLAVRQIEGKGLTELVPSLAKLVDGSEMTDGSLDAVLEATLRVNRRTPTEFDLRRGFDGEIRIADVVYRDHADAQPVAGLESITFEGLRVAPAFAGGTVKLLTVNKPLARVKRDAQGIHVLGWTIKLPASESPTSQESPATVPTAVVEAPKTESAPAGPTPSEFKIDRFLVSGCDVLLTDVSVDPPLVVPINALDVEVKGLTNLALVQDRPIRFSALVGADKVELPTRARKEAATATEFRPLMSQVTATGALKLYPKPDGYVKAAVNGFEMQSLAGESKAFGITVGDGIFDGAFDARFRDGGNLDLRTTLVVTDLKLSEQPNGLLQRTFTPGTPIDAAIGFAQDAGGSITFPLSAKIRNGELNMGSVIGSVIGGVSQVMITAIASAPAKLLQGMFGEQGGNEPPAPPVVLQFLPGDSSLEPALRAELDGVILALRKDRDRVVTLSHHFSAEDAARASVLASPTIDQITQMTASLRSRRVELMNSRSRLAADLAAQIATGVSTPDDTTRLREIDREIVANDTSLENILNQTRPGADLQIDRRMKAAAIEQANARLAAVRAYLEASKVEQIGERISVGNPRFEVDTSLTGGGTLVVESITRKRAR